MTTNYWKQRPLLPSVRTYDGTFRDPYLSNMLNFDPYMPPFFLYYEKGELVGLLTVYADDPRCGCGDPGPS